MDFVRQNFKTGFNDIDSFKEIQYNKLDIVICEVKIFKCILQIA